MADDARKCLCLIYKPVLLNVGLGTSNYQFSSTVFLLWFEYLLFVSFQLVFRNLQLMYDM